MTQSLLSIFPNPEDLLSLEPEDLAGVLLEVVPGVMQNGHFGFGDLEAQLFRPFGETYSQGVHRPVELAIAEAVSWLVSQGLLVIDPSGLTRSLGAHD
jgi:hypothetical protein